MIGTFHYCRYGWVIAVLCAMFAQPPHADAQTAKPINWHRDVIPVLTKLGCNGGTCHGSFQGRGGFRLSLLGFDPAADFDALVTEARGRRLFHAAPEQSLLLRKATHQVPHGGKKRLDVASESYQIIRQWIAQGTPHQTADAPSVTKLEITPAQAVMKVGASLTVQVRAHWSDGVVQDVTHLALYESTQETVVAYVDGKLEGRGPGRAALTVRYLGQVSAAPITIPHGNAVEGAAGRNNFIDDHLAVEWKSLGLRPSTLSNDSEFLRRVHLDLTGTLPTPTEVRQFLTATDTKKRAKVIDRLLEHASYADYWALKWADLLRAHRRSLGEKGLTSFNTWLRQALRSNQPLDRITRELLTAQGNLFTNGPVAYYYVDKNPDDLAETTAQLFLGIRLQCAKCHHHPFEVWSQNDYHGMAAFFAKMKRKDTGDNGQFGGSVSLSFDPNGTWLNPTTGKPVAPQLLGEPPLKSEGDPRVTLANWITSKQNPYFARNIVNRYWGYLFGRGLVHPIDDLRATNPAVYPALLDALANDFVEHQFDLKHLLRTICNSRAYQLACEVNPQRDQEGLFFTYRKPRRIPAEVLYDAISAATAQPNTFDKLPPGTAALALPDPTVISAFLDVFGRPKRTSTCECERSSRLDLAQVLHLTNNEALHQRVVSDQSRVALLLAQKKTDQEIIDELYLATLSRLPTKEEVRAVQQEIATAPTKREGLEDLLWALLNCAEFVFNH